MLSICNKRMHEDEDGREVYSQGLSGSSLNLVLEQYIVIYID